VGEWRGMGVSNRGGMERDGGEVELGVVSVHVKTNTVLLDNVTQWQHVNKK